MWCGMRAGSFWVFTPLPSLADRRLGWRMAKLGKAVFTVVAAAMCPCGMWLTAQAAYLNLTRIGEGTIHPDVGVYSYARGTRVTLTATPLEGWVVDHWEGDITGTGTTKTASMSGNKRATVVFRPLVPSSANALARYVGEWDTN